MALINLMVPYDSGPEVRAMVNDDFKIVWTEKHRKMEQRYFLVETTDEIVTLLKLKFGSAQVWQR